MQLAKIFEAAEIHVLLAVRSFQVFFAFVNYSQSSLELHILISLLPMSEKQSNQTITFN